MKIATFSPIRRVPIVRMMLDMRGTSCLADHRDMNAVIVDTAASLIIVLDRAGRIVQFNRACEQASGWNADEVIGRVFWEFLIDPSDEAAIREGFGELCAGDYPRRSENDWVARNGNRRRIVWSNSCVLDLAGEVEFVVASGNDITERRAVELRLRESEERFALAVRGANDGLWDWNLKTDRLYFSSRWKAMLGYRESEIGDKPEDWFGRVHHEDVDRVLGAVRDHLAGRTPHVEIEHRMRNKHGAWLWMLARGLAIRDAAGNAYRMAGSQTDITERKAVEEQLYQQAMCDSLTGLANRALITEKLQHALNRSQRNESFRYAVLFLDLDRFKIVNDGLGHLVGDQLIREFARRLLRCVRPTDTVARLGGDEFIVLLEELKHDTDATRVANRVHAQLKKPFKLGDHEVFTTASIGIAPGSPRYRNVQDLLRDADAAMYRAKALGKARHELFDDAMHEKAMETLQLETDLRHAVERGEFLLHYQPIIALADGKLTGVEALVRWNHPDRGMISPGLFIPMMEETGLIVPLGTWVMREACGQLRRWLDRYPQFAHLKMSINVSGKHFARADLVGEVKQALGDTGVSPANLSIEITESVTMINADRSAAMLAELRQAGVSIHVDDFGVGYSSLSQLHRFPIDALKIDRSFVSRIGGDERDAEIIRTIVTLGHNLGMTVTAEGIETPLQMDRMRALGVEYGQGYFISRPVDAGRIEAMLEGGLSCGAAFAAA